MCTLQMKLCNHYIYTCIALRGVLTSVLQESQGLTTYAFVMLLLAMVSLHMLTFKLMVTTVSEFCSLVILIHNMLQGEIMIYTIWTTGYKGKIILYSPVRNDTFPFKLVDFMVIVLCFFKKNKKEDGKHGQNVEITFSDIMYITAIHMYCLHVLYWEEC